VESLTAQTVGAVIASRSSPVEAALRVDGGLFLERARGATRWNAPLRRERQRREVVRTDEIFSQDRLVRGPCQRP
jgi:hypothetical protein